MEDKQEAAIAGYDLTVHKRYRSRGGWVLETKSGPKLLREYETIRSHFQLENSIKEYLINKGFSMVDDVMPNTDGEAVTELETGEKYVVYNWFLGDECDLRSETCLAAAGENLGRLHKAVEGFVHADAENFAHAEVEAEKPGSLLEQMRRHNRELKRVNSYMKGKKRKSEFEIYAINCFQTYYEKACEAADRLEGCGYYLTAGERSRSMYHGDYNYHNLIMTGRGTATIGFEKAGYGIQLLDLTYFMRKTLEKNGWSRRAGEAVIKGYDKVNTLSEEELGFVGIILAYPEKYWKLMNHYINKKKSWMPAKNLEKLKDVRSLEKRREEFLSQFAGT